MGASTRIGRLVRSAGFRSFRSTAVAPKPKKSDYEFIASVITDLKIRILLLEEINGKLVQLVDEDGDPFEDDRSPELEKLIGILGTHFDYVIAESGGTQRIAILFDTRFAQLNAACETNFPQLAMVTGMRQASAFFFDRRCSLEASNPVSGVQDKLQQAIDWNGAVT